MTDEETRNMNDYILNINLAKGSGEYCICEHPTIVYPDACIDQTQKPIYSRLSPMLDYLSRTVFLN